MPYSVIASQPIFPVSEKSTASGILLCEIDFGRFGVVRGGPEMEILQKRQSSKGVFEGVVHFQRSLRKFTASGFLLYEIEFPSRGN